METRNDTRAEIRSLFDGLRRDLAGAGLGSGERPNPALRLAPAQTCPTCDGAHDTDVHLSRARGLRPGDEIVVMNDAREFEATVTEVVGGMVYFEAADDAALRGKWLGVEPARNCYR